MIRASSLDKPYLTTFTNGSQSSVADVPLEKGGNGNGFGPHELLEAALATCLTMTVQMYAEKHQLPLTWAESVVRIDRSIPGAATLDYDLTFEGSLTDEQKAQLWEAAIRCPVACTLTGSLALNRATKTDVRTGGAA